MPQETGSQKPKTKTAKTAQKKSAKHAPPQDRATGVTQSFRAQQKFEKKVAREASNAVLPLMRESQMVTNSKRIKDIKNHAKSVALVPRLDKWLRLLARPFDVPICKCPVNYNPVPSFMTSLSRTTYTMPNLSIAIGTTSQYALFGGHGVASELASMDGVAYHARQQGANVTSYAVGPMPLTGGIGAIGGVYSSNIALASARAVTNTANDFPVAYDVPLPYLASPSESGHSRWKLIAMALRCENTTPLMNRGGNVVSVQPASKGTFNAEPISQAAMATNPSWNLTEEANTGTYVVSWIPRPEDLAFWHSLSPGEEGGTNAVNHAGLFVWINNPTATAQTYSVQIVFHWELSGSYLDSVSSPSIHQPADKNVLEPVMDLARFTSSGAQHAVDFAKHVAGNIGPMRAGAVPILAGVGGAAKILLDTMA